ncbi:MAG TPA: ABC transporter substrate-binding protein [Streptosporangiaceae bacterium]|nr:ABC transporter substrate-binding protein [Streptosporangiaceae bacterium]
MSPDEAAVQPPQERSITRRSVLRGLGAGALATGAGGVLAACSSGSGSTSASSSTGTIKIGYIAPFTGAISGFASGDRYVLDIIRSTPAFARGIKVGGRTYQVNIIVTDSQSDPNRASQLARQLILNNNVDMLLVSSTPETVNPVAVVAQTEGVPCVGTNDPWESWYAGLGGDPTKTTATFQYCTLFFFGLKDLNDCFVPMWNRVKASSKNVALQYPNDADGNAFRAALPILMQADGYNGIDGGAYNDGTTDFTPMITKFKQNDCQYLSNCPLPPDFNRFWRQANRQGWKPRLATVAKVLLFPADTVALGPLVNNIATDSWWGPYMPYHSSLDPKLGAKQLADNFTASTGRQWVQSIGGTYSLFEVAHQAFRSVSDPHDRAEVANAIHKVNYTGMSGQLDFSGGPAPGVAVTKIVGVQWKATTSGSRFPFEMRVVDHTLNPAVPLTGKLEPTNPA